MHSDSVLLVNALDRRCVFALSLPLLIYIFSNLIEKPEKGKKNLLISVEMNETHRSLLWK